MAWARGRAYLLSLLLQFGLQLLDSFVDSGNVLMVHFGNQITL